MSDGDDAGGRSRSGRPRAPSYFRRASASGASDVTPKDKYGVLVGRVRDALRVLPSYFESETHIDGIEAGGLFSLNSVLGGALEIQSRRNTEQDSFPMGSRRRVDSLQVSERQSQTFRTFASSPAPKKELMLRWGSS